MQFTVVWLSGQCEEIGEEAFLRENIDAVVRSAALRIRQSPFLCPDGTRGFYVREERNEISSNLA